MKDYLKILAWVILFSFNWAKVHAQSSKLDSLQLAVSKQKADTGLVKTLLLLSMEYFKAGDMQEMQTSINRALSLAYDLQSLKEQSICYLQMSAVYQALGRRQDALQKALKGLAIMEKTKNKTDIGKAMFAVGVSYQSLEEHAMAMKFYEDAVSIHESLGNKDQLGSGYYAMGNCSYWWGKYEDAKTYFEKALQIFLATGKELQTAECYIYLAMLESDQNNYPTALKLDSAALKIYSKLKFNHGMGYALSGFASVFQKLGETLFPTHKKDSAISYLNEAINNNRLSAPYFFHSGDSGALGDLQMKQGRMYTTLGKFREAKIHLDSALIYAKALQYKDNLKTSYQTLAYFDSARGNYQDAYEHFKLFILYRDSITDEESQKKFLETKLETEYESRMQTAKAAQLKKDLKNRNVRDLQYLAMAFLAFMGIAIAIIAVIQYRSSKQRKKDNGLLAREKNRVEVALIDLKSTQAQLIQSEKMASLGELTAGIAHEIQNPLNFVNNFSELSRELIEELKSQKSRVKNEEEQEILNDLDKNLEKINHHGKRADAIVKGMLQHSRSSNGIKEPTDINALADEYLHLAYHGLRAKDKSFNANIKTEFDHTLNKINIIPQDIGRVLLNLFNNAFYAVNEKKKQNTAEYIPEVTISTALQKPPLGGLSEGLQGGAVAVITISDNGNGIPQNVLNKIFQPFFTTKPTGQGTGLGLSLSYDIVKAHGGELTAETKTETQAPTGGTGSSFTIMLPMAKT